jgi:hypothetical protein
MDKVINSIDEFIDFNVIRFHRTTDGKDHFYLMEQSALQVLREITKETPIEVTSIFSESHRVAKQVGNILSAKSVEEFFKIVLPLVENGSFPCMDLTIILENQIELSSHDDGEVHLISSNHVAVRNLIEKILRRQHFDETFLGKIVQSPNVYHKIEAPDKIIATFETFDQLIEAI